VEAGSAAVSGEVFIDETKHRNYVVVAAVVVPGDLAALRRTVRGLVLPGQRRVHMTKESAPRRRLIADTIVRSGVTAVVFDAGDAYPSELDARQACLRGVISYADYAGATRLVLERDDSLLAWDARRLWEITGEVGCRDTLRYSHARASEELLLAIPDAIAWCWAKGGDWRRRIRPVITGVEVV